MEPTTPNAQLNGWFRYAAPTLPTLMRVMRQLQFTFQPLLTQLRFFLDKCVDVW